MTTPPLPRTSLEPVCLALAARLKLEEAQAALVRAKAAYDAGTASATEYRAARLAKDIAEGESRGDTAAILRAKLQFAEEEYVQAETKDKAGLATIGELDKAKLAKEVAEANRARLRAVLQSWRRVALRRGGAGL